MSREQRIKVTPDKCRDQAAATVAAKLLNSAKKSRTKQHAKNPQKLSTCSDIEMRSSARSLVFSPLRDLNDTMEFKKTTSRKRVPRLQLATRKRKKLCDDDRGSKAKSTRKGMCSTTSENYRERSPQQNLSKQNIRTLKPCSDQSVSSPKSNPNLSLSLPSTESTDAADSKTERMDRYDESETDSQGGKDLSMSLHACPACGQMFQRGTFVRHMRLCLQQHCENEEAHGDCGEILKGEISDHSEPIHIAELKQKDSVKEETEEDPMKEDGDDPGQEEKRDPVKGEKRDPVKGEKRDPVKEGKRDPVKEEKRDPVKEEKRDPVKEEKRDPVREEKRDPVKGEKDSLLLSEYCFCQLCQKDLSHLNSHRRTLHINKCIDQEDKKKEEVEERQRALEAAKHKVLDCPMCGKVLLTAQSRKNHLKKCASSLEVGPKQLLAAVRRQEEEHLATLAAGILPARPGGSTRQHSTTSSRKGIGSLPKSKLDEDTQLALALSTSLQPDTEETGASTSAPSRRGRKNKQEENCLLLTLSEKQAAGRIENRVSDLITMEVEDEEVVVPTLPHLNQLSFHGQTVQWSAEGAMQQSKMFWCLASLDNHDGERESSSADPLQYYVPALMPPVHISSVVAGSKIRRMSEIPGRRRSLDAVGNLQLAPDDEQAASDERHADGSLPPFSTQTAALLADMAAEAEMAEQPSQQSLSSSQMSDIQQQAYQDLLSAFSSLVNKEEYSDVSIRTAGSVSLSAHRLILSARCPALLQLMDTESRGIDLSEWSAQCVLAVLQFVYSGDTQVHQELLPSVLQLADRLGLTSLAQICGSRLNTPATSKISSSSLEHKEQLSQTMLSKHSAARTCTETHSADLLDDSRKSRTAAAGEEDADHRQGVSSSPEGRLPAELSPGAESAQSISPAEGCVSDSSQSVRSLSSSSSSPPIQLTQVKVAKDYMYKTGTGGLEDDQQAVLFKNFESKTRENLTERFLEVDDDVGEGVNVVSDPESCGFSTKSEIQEVDTASEITCETAEVVEEKAMEISCSASGLEESSPTCKNKESSDGFFSSDDNEFIPLKKDTAYEYHPSLDMDKIQVEEVRTKTMQKKNSQTVEQPEISKSQQYKSEETQKKTMPPVSKHCEIAKSPQSFEPVDSIEVSDEDLFSSDDMDVSLISSAPHVQNRDEKDEANNGCEGGKTVPKTDKKLLSASPDPQLTQKGQTLHGKGFRENIIHERTRNDDGSYVTEDQQLEKQRCQLSAFDHSLSSVSISAIEGSYQRSSTFDQKRGQFQTSTPSVPTKDTRLNRTVSKVKSKDRENIGGNFSSSVDSDITATFNTDFAKSQTVVQDKGSLRLNDSGDKSLESMCQLGNRQTPRASVVEQDSLYVTPVVEQSNMRSTFQLVTPLLQQAVQDSPHRPTKTSLVVQNTSKSDASISSRRGRKQTHRKENDSRDGLPEHSLQRRLSTELKSVPQTRQKAADSPVAASTSDSDLEIIDESIQNAPSPKFSRLNSSQPQSAGKTSTLSSPEKQSKLSPQTTAHTTPTKSPMGARSHSLSAACRSSQPGGYHSPPKASPCSSGKGFSQRSAESDNELLMVTELLCQAAEGEQQGTGGGREEEELSGDDLDTVDANKSAEDIWDGFDNLEDYNPDFYLNVAENSTHSDPHSPHSKIGEQKTPSPTKGPTPIRKSPSKVEHNPSSPFKIPADLPKKAKETRVELSKEKMPIPSVSKLTKQTSRRQTHREEDTPVKLRSSVSETSPARKRSCNALRRTALEEEKKTRRRSSQVGDPQSPDFLLNAGDGFLLASEDTEAANSSFLWSEENAPSEDCVLVEDRGSKPCAVRDLAGLGEIAATQGGERQLIHTPVQHKKDCKRSKAAVMASPFTPMPSYDVMTTPQLKNQVQKYGLKPVGKKRMKLVLKDIYHKTHQYETDSDYDENSSHLPNLDPPVLNEETNPPVLAHRQSKKPKRKPASGGDRPQAQGLPVCSQASPGKPGKRPKTKRGLAQKATDRGKPQSTSTAPHRSNKTGSGVQRGHPNIPSYHSPSKGRSGKDDNILQKASPAKSLTGYSTSPEKGLSSSQDSDASERPDVSVFEEERLDSDDNEEITPSQQVAAKDLPQRLMSFIRNNPDWHCKILTYEPLDLGVLKEDLKTAGIKCSQDKLLDFLDEKCITFTTKNMIPRKRRNRGKKPPSKKVAASQK